MAFLVPPSVGSSQYPSNQQYTPPMQAQISQPNSFYLPIAQNSGSLPSSPVFYNAHQRIMSVAPVSARSTPRLTPTLPQNPLLQISPFQAASNYILPNYYFPSANTSTPRLQSRLSVSQLQQSNQMTRADLQVPQPEQLETCNIKTDRNTYVSSLTKQKISHTKSQHDLTPSIHWQTTLQLLPGETEHISNTGKTLEAINMKHGENQAIASRPYLYLANVLNSQFEGAQSSTSRKYRSNRPSISRNIQEEAEQYNGMDLPKSAKHLHSLKFMEPKIQISDRYQQEDRLVERPRSKEPTTSENHFGFNNKDTPSQKALPIYKYDSMFNIKPRKSASIKPPQDRELSEEKHPNRDRLENSIEERANINLRSKPLLDTPKTDRGKAKFNVALREYIKDPHAKELKHLVATSHGNRERTRRDPSGTENRVFELKNLNHKAKKPKSQVKLPPVNQAPLKVRQDVSVVNKEIKKVTRGKEQTNTEAFENELSDVLLFGFNEEIIREEPPRKNKNLPDLLADLEALDTLPS